jgi:hypothetical protein
MRRRVMARPMRLTPFWAARPGDLHRERPGPHRERPLDQHRHDDPLMSPPVRCIAVGRAHTIAMASRAEDGGPGRSATVSSPASNTGPVGTTSCSRTVSNLRASSQADQRLGENTR